MPSESRQKKIMEKLNRAQKCSILGPQNLGSREGPGPPGTPGSASGSTSTVHSAESFEKHGSASTVHRTKSLRDTDLAAQYRVTNS